MASSWRDSISIHGQEASMNVVNMKKIDLRPDLASIEADRMLIEQTASYVKNLWQQLNAAETYIAAGREFKNLHGHLSKTKARDETRIGWHRAFAKEENKFGLDRRTAECYIGIHDAFFHLGNACPMWKLPQTFSPLHALAKLKLSGDQLQACIADGSLKPNSREADIRRLATKFKPVPPKTKPKAESETALAKPAKITKIAQARLDGFFGNVGGLLHGLEALEESKPKSFALIVQEMADSEAREEIQSLRNWLNRLLAMSKAEKQHADAPQRHADKAKAEALN